MRKLETDVYYLRECQACKERVKYIARADNVNPMSDEDIMFVVRNGLGKHIDEVCENCGLFSRHVTIGYRWHEIKATKQTKD